AASHQGARRTARPGRHACSQGRGADPQARSERGGACRPAEPTQDRAVIMAELATIARPYAEALFRVARAGNLSAWSDLVSEMAQVAALPEVKMLADNPKVTAQQTTELFL